MRGNSVVLNLNNRGNIKAEYMGIVFTILMAMFVLSNCAPRVIPGPVYFYPKVEPVDIELKSFSFYPNHIAILKDTLSRMLNKRAGQLACPFSSLHRKKPA